MSNGNEQALATISGNLQAYGLTPADWEALRNSIAKEASPAELRVHLMITKSLGLSPVGGMVHFVKRGGQWRTEVGIDGFRSLAENTRQYQGPAYLPKFQYEDGGQWTEVMKPRVAPVAAKVGVRRKGWPEPVEAVALYSEYVQYNDKGEPNAIWARRPAHQLAKCAEALALRQAFPRKLGGIYTSEEMAHVGEDSVAIKKPVDGEVIDAEAREVQALTTEQRRALVALGNALPAPGKEGYGGPTKWPPGKYKAEFERLGSFDAVREELENQLAESKKLMGQKEESHEKRPEAPKAESSETGEGEATPGEQGKLI